MKSHDVITWTLPSGRTTDAEPADHRYRIDVMTPTEHHVARFIQYVA